MRRIHRMVSYAILAAVTFLLMNMHSLLVNRSSMFGPVHVELGRPTSDHTPEINTEDKLPYVWNTGMPAVSIVDEPSPEAVVDNSFRSRLRRFNAALDSIRSHVTKTWIARGNDSWPVIHSGNLVLIRGDDHRFMDSLDAFDDVITVVLPWAVSPSRKRADLMRERMPNTAAATAAAFVWNEANDTWNLAIRDYYTWTGDERLCKFVDTPGVHTNVPRDRNCSTNVEDAFRPTVLNPIYLDWTPSMSEKSATDGSDLVRASFADRLYHVTASSQLYIHLIERALVTSIGDVITDQFKFVPFGCVPVFSLEVSKNEEIAATPVVNELFVASQFWGVAVFHRAVEVVPRLAPFLDFLHRNPAINVHVPETGGRMAELAELFGLDRRRLVNGPVRARIAYLPPITHCGQAGVRQIQLTAEIYRTSLRKMAIEKKLGKRVVLIQRTGKRRFLRPVSIERAVRAAARDFGLEFSLFGDDPSPPLNETMSMFHSAVMVVGPHGAGESNVVFSRPGLFVVEVVCTNMCLKHMSHVMGHRWHGLQARNFCRRGVVDIDPANVDRAVRRHLAIWKRL